MLTFLKIAPHILLLYLLTSYKFMMDKFVVKGIKKIFSLTRTKIRLAEESHTVYVKPRPLPLVKILSGKKINTIEEAKQYMEEMKEHMDYSQTKDSATTVLQLMDIIEGVKYRYEPDEFMPQITENYLKKMEDNALKENSPMNIQLMTLKSYGAVNLFIGKNPPENTILLGGVPSNLAFFLRYALKSDYFSKDLMLRNVKSIRGARTLIINAIHHSLGVMGADTEDERIIHSAD